MSVLNNRAIIWAKKYLHELGEVVESEQKINNMPWSFVYRIKTDKRVIFLKQTPVSLYLETSVLYLLNQLNLSYIPNLVAVNKPLCAFLISSIGDISLRALSDQKLMIDLFIKGAVFYTKLQRYFEGKTSLLRALGAQDYTLDNLPTLYNHLLNHQSQLQVDGLRHYEYKKLVQLTTKLIELSDKLKSYQIPETLNHCDFHDGNLIFNQISNNVGIIDWGEIAICHPFFSLNACLWNLVYQRDLDTQSKVYHNLKLELIKPWLDRYDQKNLIEAFNLAGKLNGFYAALGYQFIYTATEDEVLPASVYKKGAISGCLRSFISDNS
ncbi:MAG: aminoglycoside phosphotransferase family protein [Gammaproteobacteria bacterium]|nr:MAG: aminoglycoside phosphotransferase family protein [Gammaproteobacteria bacterium]UTW42335.1 aminoglycoside phosphotransferase family protein [bacterium SCSIO 12844]